MASFEEKDGAKFQALINYEDPYVQPLILAALKSRLPESTYELITAVTQELTPTRPLLQWVQYESIDFDGLMDHSSTCMANAYIIRKALIRKHYLSTTIANWITKYPESCLKHHVKPSVEFEVDYAEFLDDALIEAWDLKESWARNEALNDEDEAASRNREWWILKPGMSDRGQGIRLFSSEEELTEIFEEWDPESDDEEEEEDARSDAGDGAQRAMQDENEGDGIMTSQLRHFVAQPYIHPPLLLQAPGQSPDTTSTLKKFHIRTYVLATGALQVHVYRPMLALFAARDYLPPWNQVLQEDREEAMKAHLTNTCLQDSGDRDGSVGLFWDMPDDLPSQPDFLGGTTSIAQANGHDWKQKVFEQICAATGETFKAAAKGMSIHFQTLPNAFEIFGLDFMVGLEADGQLQTYLLEVNAFPDFRQTGDDLKGMIEGLFEGVVDVAIAPFFGVETSDEPSDEKLVEVLNTDMGRR